MAPDFRSALVSLCRSVLYPLIQIVMRFGVSVGEFKAIVDSVYAHAGSEYLERSGERASYSKLAVITGLSRAYLPELLLVPKNIFKPRSDTQLHRAARVLAGWHEDPKYRTRSGTPAVLALGGSSKSFKRLCEIYSGNVYHQTLLSELERVQAVRRVGKNKVQALRRTVFSEGATLDSIDAVGNTVGDLLATFEHNLRAKPEEMLPVVRYVGAAEESMLPLFRRQVERRADGLMEAAQAVLQTRSQPANVGSQSIELGAAVFVIRREFRSENSR